MIVFAPNVNVTITRVMDVGNISETFESLKNVYNFLFHLKTEQIAVIHCLMNKRNVFALLPTGYGKSMCFTLPRCYFTREVSIICNCKSIF